MRLLALLAALATCTTAQTAAPIPPPSRLDVVFGPRPIHAPGALMHPGHMSSPPSISTPTSAPSSLLLMLDLDWPLSNTRVSRLHWLVTDLTPSAPVEGNTTSLLTIPDPVVPYIAPAPPVGDVAHTYAFFLFKQPGGWVLPVRYRALSAGDGGEGGDTEDKRAPFDLDQFLSDCGLQMGDLLARNHVRVRNLAGHPTVAFPAARETGVGMGEGEVLGEGEGQATQTQTQGAQATGGVGGFGVSEWAVGVGVVCGVLGVGA